mmetsp:Transcript_1894/g.2723  ORF Transcript_1894/g.2723 Transcript_1894/m.2723 type:complete len:337 (+) Transcript_1894:36-1046(+)
MTAYINFEVSVNDDESQIFNLNTLNFLGYLINVGVTFGASTILDFPDNAELSEKYQTLVTPKGTAFAIWGAIFILQFIFTVAQLTDKYRSSTIVQKGVGQWYFYTCLSQAAWTFAFGYEIVLLSLAFMSLILFTLLKIVTVQDELTSTINQESFWLLQFPFQLHCGWIFAAFAINFNVVLVAFGASESIQIFFAVLSLFDFVAIAAFLLFYSSQSSALTISSVLAWATFWIMMELDNPRIENFSESNITKIKFATMIVFAAILIMIIVKTVDITRRQREGIETYDDGVIGVTIKKGEKKAKTDKGKKESKNEPIVLDPKPVLKDLRKQLNPKRLFT